MCYDACKYLTGGDVIKLDTDQGQGFFQDVLAQLKRHSYVSTSVRSSAAPSTAKAVGLVAGHACKHGPLQRSALGLYNALRLASRH